MKKEMTFEEAIVRLEEISKALGDGASLEQSLELYEEGAKLAAFCSKALKNAEQKLITLSQIKENDNDD